MCMHVVCGRGLFRFFFFLIIYPVVYSLQSCAAAFTLCCNLLCVLFVWIIFCCCLVCDHIILMPFWSYIQFQIFQIEFNQKQPPSEITYCVSIQDKTNSEGYPSPAILQKVHYFSYLLAVLSGTIVKCHLVLNILDSLLHFKIFIIKVLCQDQAYSTLYFIVNIDGGVPH